MQAEQFETENDKSDPLERYGKICRAHDEDRKRMNDPVLSSIDALRWALGFGRKGAVENAIDADMEASVKAGEMERPSIFDMGDEDTLVMESRLRKAGRWIPRLVIAGIAATAITSFYGGEIKDAMHTSVGPSVQSIKDFVSR